MDGKKFRRRLFGFKKADVYDYIKELDARYAEAEREKNSEIERISLEKANLSEKYDELQSKREVIVSVLERAHIEADGIVAEAKTEASRIKEDAARTALEMKNNAETEIEEKKAEANREIELRRRALRNMYESESRRIEHLRSEVTELRKNSLEAIRLFERELSDVEVKLGYKERAADDAITDIKYGGRVETFKDVKIPIKVIKRKAE